MILVISSCSFSSFFFFIFLEQTFDFVDHGKYIHFYKKKNIYTRILKKMISMYPLHIFLTLIPSIYCSQTPTSTAQPSRPQPLNKSIQWLILGVVPTKTTQFWVERPLKRVVPLGCSNNLMEQLAPLVIPPKMVSSWVERVVFMWSFERLFYFLTNRCMRETANSFLGYGTCG